MIALLVEEVWQELERVHQRLHKVKTHAMP
jgi:hypothetical protein